jgi:hypothetical protein
MKIWLISLCGLLTFLILSLFVQSYLDRSADLLSRELTGVEPELQSLNWDQALNKLDSFAKAWGKTKPLWAVLTNHNEMDLIEETLIKTTQAISSKSYSDALINLGILRNFIKHIPDKERFSIVNIF